jgi:hypothetical protein
MKYRDGDLPQLPREPALLDNNQQDYATQLNKALGLQVRPPGHIDARLGVGIQLDDWTRPEFQFLRRMNLYTVRGSVIAVAGQFPVMQLIANVPNSIIVVESALLFNNNGVAQTVSWGWGGFDGGTTQTPDPRDSRNFGNPGSAYVTINTSAAPTAPSPVGGQIQLAVNQTSVVDLNYVVVNPTKGFVNSPVFKLLGNTVNQTLNAVISYRERVLLQTEVQ